MACSCIVTASLKLNPRARKALDNAVVACRGCPVSELGLVVNSSLPFAGTIANKTLSPKSCPTLSTQKENPEPRTWG